MQILKMLKAFFMFQLAALLLSCNEQSARENDCHVERSAYYGMFIQ